VSIRWVVTIEKAKKLGNRLVRKVMLWQGGEESSCGDSQHQSDDE
jgi:hypothetical protein